MLTSLSYFAYLYIALIAYWLSSKLGWNKYVLSISSLLFIGFYSKFTSIYIVALSVITYCLGLFVSKGKVAGKLSYWIGIVFLVLNLFIAKYLGLFDIFFQAISKTVLAGMPLMLESVFIPLGISYITFKYISYLTDLKWRIAFSSSFTDLLAYGSFFPIYFAGPLERFDAFRKKLVTPIQLDDSLIKQSVMRIVFGLFKKIVISNWIYSTVISKGSNGAGLRELILYIVAYTVYIYIDFSAYSDIAIASAKLFGIEVMENFDHPYSAKNISDFWKRWHISLSTWIRDYIFFPLSKLSQKRIWMLFCVPLLAMGLCGLWHGASVFFLAWGLFHGLLISLYQLRGKNLARKMFKEKKLTYSIVANGILLILIMGSWYIFSYRSVPSYGIETVSIRKQLQILSLLIITIFSGYHDRIPIITKLKDHMQSVITKNTYLVMLATILLTVMFGVYTTDSSFVYVDF